MGMNAGLGIASGVQGQVQSNVSTSANVVAGKRESKAERRRIADINRQLRLNAAAVEAAGYREAVSTLDQGKRLMEDTKGNLVASGRDLGSPGTLKQLTRMEDVIQYNALASIYEARQTASKDRYEAALNDIKAQQIKRNAELARYAGLMQTKLV